MNSITEKETRGECPVCGTSWQGPSFVYIYTTFLSKTGHGDLSDDEIRTIAHRHASPHQSRLLQSPNDDNVRICPDCGTKYMVAKSPTHGRDRK